MMILSNKYFFKLSHVLMLIVTCFVMVGCKHIKRSDYTLPRAKVVRTASGEYRVQLRTCHYPNVIGMEASSPDEFGCITERNFEVMLANPVDLVRPRRLTSIPADQFRHQQRGGSSGRSSSGGIGVSTHSTY